MTEFRFNVEAVCRRAYADPYLRVVPLVDLAADRDAHLLSINVVDDSFVFPIARHHGKKWLIIKDINIWRRFCRAMCFYEKKAPPYVSRRSTDLNAPKRRKLVVAAQSKRKALRDRH